MPAVAAESAWFLDTYVSFAVSGDDRQLSVIESLARRGDSPPLHVQQTEDELFVVLDGTVTVIVDGERSTLGAGEVACAPRGVPHTYRVDSEQARWLAVTTHGDFEAFMRAASRPADRDTLPPPSGPPTPDQIQQLEALADRHGIAFVGPPLAG